MKNKSMNEHRRSVERVLVALTGVLILSGCSSVKVNSGTATPFETRANPVLRAGVSVVTEPLLDPARVEQVFGGNVLKQGVLPVYVTIRNEGKETVLADRFVVSGPGIQGEAGSEISIRSKGGEAIGFAGAALISLPLLFMASGMISDANTTQHNMYRQQFLNQTLAAGESASGFVYFTQKKPVDPGKAVVVTIEARQLETGAILTFTKP